VKDEEGDQLELTLAVLELLALLTVLHHALELQLAAFIKVLR